jgi:hypothetical protein
MAAFQSRGGGTQPLPFLIERIVLRLAADPERNSDLGFAHAQTGNGIDNDLTRMRRADRCVAVGGGQQWKSS